MPPAIRSETNFLARSSAAKKTGTTRGPSQDAAAPAPKQAVPGTVVVPPQAAVVDSLPFLAELRWLINGLIARARHPNGSIRVVTRQEFADFEQALRRLELRWEQREKQLAREEFSLATGRAELDRKSQEFKSVEARLVARERLVESTRTPFSPGAPVGAQTQAALEALRAQLTTQEASLAKMRQDLRDRQKFIDEAEAALARKMEAQDQMAALLDQRAEDLAMREQALSERMGGAPAKKERA